MLLSQFIPPSPSPTVSTSLFSMSVSHGGGTEKREPSCTVDGKANLYSHYEEQYGDCLKKKKKKKLGIKLPFDPTIPLLVTYSEETITEKDTCIKWSCMDVRIGL